MNGEILGYILLTQLLACGLLMALGGEEELPWQNWELAPESVVFLHACAVVVAIPILAAVILGAIGYGAWYLAKGAVSLVRDVKRHALNQRSKPEPVTSGYDAAAREAAAEVERLLSEV